MNADRCLDVTLGIRHRFVSRIVDQTHRTDFAFEINDYPIKIGPLRDGHRKACDWTYSTNLLGFSGCHGIDGLRYGDRVPDEVVMEDLTRIVTTALGYGLDMMRAFDPQTAARVIADHGSRAWCENMWLEDYRAHLSKAEHVVAPNGP